jgi:hypothetical protein
MWNVLMEITYNAHRVGIRTALYARFMHLSVISVKHRFLQLLQLMLSALLLQTKYIFRLRHASFTIL